MKKDDVVIHQINKKQDRQMEVLSNKSSTLNDMMKSQTLGFFKLISYAAIGIVVWIFTLLFILIFWKYSAIILMEMIFSIFIVFLTSRDSLSKIDPLSEFVVSWCKKLDIYLHSLIILFFSNAEPSVQKFLLPLDAFQIVGAICSLPYLRWDLYVLKRQGRIFRCQRSL